MPDVSSILITLSKAFSPFGDDATYYLNESKHLQRWCDANERALINLPSRKGSRQGWTLSVGTAVMLNVESYSEYMNEIRADDQELNQLISGSWEAVKDKYFIAAVSARSFVDVVFARPLNYFVHSDFSGRHDLSKIMACAETWISNLGCLDDIGKAPPPALDSLSSLILAEFPGWEEEYSWWFNGDSGEGGVGGGFADAYKLATGSDRWHHVMSHLCAAREHMLATHRRNLDGDCSGNEDLKHAPKVSDEVEAGFGCFDCSLNKAQASVGAAMHCGQPMKMGAMKNDAQIHEDARATASAKKKKWEARGKHGEFDFSAVMAAAVAEMKVTSWRNAISRDEYA